jgi:hypothetical protein
VTMKKTELEKRKALKIANEMRRTGNPYGRAGETEADRRAQRERDRALGLVPFAVKLPQDLVRQMQAASAVARCAARRSRRRVAAPGTGGLTAVSARGARSRGSPSAWRWA